MLEHFQSHTLGLAHLVVALLATLSGALVLAARKGTATHRRLGRAYLLLMLALNVTALAIYELFGRFGPFHWMALVSLATVLAGYRAARRRSAGWKTRHAYLMAGSYVGLIAALASEILTRVPGLPFAGAVVGASVVVIAAGLGLMARLIPATVQGSDRR